MVKVITYGTYDLLHYGHIKLLERAKALGDYLIVGVTSDDFDKVRGKINVKQSLPERMTAVKATGLADEIIVEEYEGQKIDDIKHYGIDIFTVGSDWVGEFDYLNDYCKVVYLPRTEGISSSDIRAQKRALRFGLAGESTILIKYANECRFVNGIEITGICTKDQQIIPEIPKEIFITSSYDELLERVDAIYLVSHPSKHFDHIKNALTKEKHVLCESPITLTKKELDELLRLAKGKNIVLMDAIKTAYSTAYRRLLLLIKSGCIGKIVSVDANCTSLSSPIDMERSEQIWNSISAWGPAAMLPIFQLLGTDYLEKHITSNFIDEEQRFDTFTKIDFLYHNAVASLKVGKGVKSEGELIISGTKGYVYVPSPWWKTDYFEVRYENQSENKRYFYQLDGEGIRYEILNFVKAIETGTPASYIERSISREIVRVMEDFSQKKDLRCFTV